jgi:hypothetical protein
MKLTEWPGRKRIGRPSVVDLLPTDVRDQLVAARQTGSHSVSAMIEWLNAEGYGELNVTPNALYNWFTTRGIHRGDT